MPLSALKIDVKQFEHAEKQCIHYKLELSIQKKLSYSVFVDQCSFHRERSQIVSPLT